MNSFFTLQQLEILGLIFGILYVILMIKEKWQSWPFGIAAVLLYAYSCFHYKLYGEMTLQFVYVIISVFGWFNWTKNKDSFKVLSLSKMKKIHLPFVFLCGLLLSALFYIPLRYFESSLPVVDALTNGFAIVATFLAAQKKIENWLLWIPIDIVVASMMVYKNMYFYAVLYICYTLFAIYGYYQWKKQLQ